MITTKATPMTAAARRRRCDARKREAGLRRIGIWLPAGSLAGLATITEGVCTCAAAVRLALQHLAAQLRAGTVSMVSTSRKTHGPP